MSDVIHRTPRRSIYVRTDYLVNSDMTIPFSLAAPLVAAFYSEGERRVGLPSRFWDRRPQPSPLVGANRLPRSIK
jgi:hypothetical protein